jgi:hypothetical protein
MKYFDSFLEYINTPFIMGALTAFIKGLKKKLFFKMLIIQTIVGAILAYVGIEVAEHIWQENFSPKKAVAVAFILGWVSNDVTEILDRAVSDTYEIFLNYLKNKFGNGGNNKDAE